MLPTFSSGFVNMSRTYLQAHKVDIKGGFHTPNFTVVVYSQDEARQDKKIENFTLFIPRKNHYKIGFHTEIENDSTAMPISLGFSTEALADEFKSSLNTDLSRTFTESEIDKGWFVCMFLVPKELVNDFLNSIEAHDVPFDNETKLEIDNLIEPFLSRTNSLSTDAVSAQRPNI